MQVPVTIISKKWLPFKIYCKVCLKGPSTKASKVMLNPPCVYAGSICLSSDVSEKL
jgi:hypothetical protein